MSDVATAQPAAAARRAKRPEIEGLRAVAALLVAAYHIWLGRVSGGVDVFFTVTGFLITLTLLGHVDRTGRIAPLAYLGRLARRVWPMAGTVLAVSLVLTALVVPAALRPRGIEEIVASALYAENWYLAVNSIDYLNAEDPPTLVQHFWAMSIQGQFYVLWLLVFLLAGWWARRGGRPIRAVVAGLVAVVVVTSFAHSVIFTAQSQPQAYFVTTTRLWEFGLGAMVALFAARLTIGGSRAAVASWVGIVGLLSCGLVLPVQNTFPGYVALWPVLSALLLIVATRENERPWAATRVLSSRPLVRLGGVAFGIYLWHWPLLVLHEVRTTDGSQPSLLTGTVIIGASVVLALLGERFIERPVQRAWGRGRRRATTVALVALWALVLAGAFAAQERHERDVVAAQELASGQQEALAGCFGYGALQDREGCAPVLQESALVPDQAGLLADTAGAYSCYTGGEDDAISTCRFGDGGTRVAIVGNSHAAMLVPSLQRRVDDLDWQLDTFTTNGCLWGVGRPDDPDESERCQSRLQEVEDRLIDGPAYDLVIFTGGRGRLASTENIETATTSMSDLVARGTVPVVIEDNPRIGEENAQCVLATDPSSLKDGACSPDRAAAFAEQDAFVAAAEQVGAPVVETADLYCVEDTCPSVIGSVIVYRDSHHLTATYVETVIDELLERMRAQLGER